MSDKKQLTARMLLETLLEYEKQYDLSKVNISYRYDPDSDVETVTYLSEGVFDAETNNILEELVFLTDASEYQDED
jgi:hypothetical protein